MSQNDKDIHILEVAIAILPAALFTVGLCFFAGLYLAYEGDPSFVYFYKEVLGIIQ